MSLNAAVIMPPLQQCLFDKTLDTFLSEGKVYFWEDENRTVPKNVYQLTGSGPGSYTYTSLGAVLTLSGIGSFIDGSGGNIAVYLWPFTGSPNDNPPSQTVQNYYITVYSSTNVFQFDIPNWPGIEASSAGVNDADTTENILSNSQFSDVSFSSTAISTGTAISYSTTGTNTATQIAPDWYVVTTGTGSFSIYQQQITDDTAPGNPAYAIGITSTGYSQPIQLRQRLTSPRLFAGQYVSGTFIAEATDGGTYTVTMNYTPSITGTIQQICTGSTVPGGFVTIANNPPIQITDPGIGTGYVDITIVIPVSAPVQISCVQLCGVSNNAEVVTYLQQPPQRESDHLFNYYSPLLQFKPTASYLVGWDFPLNPAQFFYSGTALAVGSNKSYYIWDQTILFQSANSGITTAADTQTNGLSLTAAATGQMAVIQYLDGSKMKDLMIQAIQGLSVAIRCSSSIAQKLNVTLWWTNNTANIPAMTVDGTTKVTSGDSVVSSLDANGRPSVAAGWTEIQCQNLSSLIKTNNTNTIGDYGCFGFVDTTGVAYKTAAAFAIVVGTNSVTNGNNIVFNNISLTPGNNPTIPAAQTVDEVLRECQYYYETSYPLRTKPGTANTPTTFYAQQWCTGSNVFASCFGTSWFVYKRNNMQTANQLLIYNPVNTNDTTTVRYRRLSSPVVNNDTNQSNWDSEVINNYGFQWFSTAVSGTQITTGNLPLYIYWHYTADARLGVFT